MYSKEQLLLLLIVVSSILYVAYSCYLIHKMKKSIGEPQERRVASFMLFIIFFALSMIYQQHEHSCTFLVLWFFYALWLLVKETRKTISSDKGCFLC